MDEKSKQVLLKFVSSGVAEQEVWSKTPQMQTLQLLAR